MLVKANPVVSAPIERLPGVEMLRVGPHRDLGVEVVFAERVRQRLAVFEVVEIGAVRQEIEDKDLHVWSLRWMLIVAMSVENASASVAGFLPFRTGTSRKQTCHVQTRHRVDSTQPRKGGSAATARGRPRAVAALPPFRGCVESTR